MIPVAIKPEPLDFHQKVRQKGQNFLTLTTPTKSKDWEGHEYWRASLSDLETLYGDICAYCCLRIASCTGNPTVDHYQHKSQFHQLAYEWNNFRLAAGRMNSRKGVFTDVLDPFTVQEGWFIIEFAPAITVKPNPTLDEPTKTAVTACIKRLKLDRDENYLAEVETWYKMFANNEISFEVLSGFAPFMAYELRRQGLA